MIIYNTSFIIDTPRYGMLLTWLRETAVPAVTAPGTKALDATLMTLVEVPGDDDFTQQARNIMLQVTFDNLQDAHLWSRNSLNSLLLDYSRRFGPEAVAFRTISERLPL
ncbi:MAG: DUF4286 family protein [Muribaculaceae bacterium]|nr:DUF4286 family protein [Bacteroides sp.]MDE6803459.1 DUF4286 family protein [Muribaculaceae bacterium]